MRWGWELPRTYPGLRRWRGRGGEIRPCDLGCRGVRFTFCFAVPFGEDLGGHSDIAAKIFGAVAAEKEP